MSKGFFYLCLFILKDPVAEVHAPARNPARDSSGCRLTLRPLSHTSQGDGLLAGKSAPGWAGRGAWTPWAPEGGSPARPGPASEGRPGTGRSGASRGSHPPAVTVTPPGAALSPLPPGRRVPGRASAASLRPRATLLRSPASPGLIRPLGPGVSDAEGWARLRGDMWGYGPAARLHGTSRLSQA